MTDDEYNENHRCASCGRRFGEHACADYKRPHACPSGEFPRFPKKTPSEDPEAYKRLDKKIEKYWNTLGTVFVPR